MNVTRYPYYSLEVSDPFAKVRVFLGRSPLYTPSSIV